MSWKTTPDKEKEYAERGEGNYYRFSSFIPIMKSDEFVYREDFYTIQNGRVYLIQPNGALYASGDTCFGTLNQCVLMGKYKEGMKKKVVTRNFTRKQFLSIMKRRLLKKKNER